MRCCWFDSGMEIAKALKVFQLFCCGLLLAG